jgi:hypothetical protein
MILTALTKQMGQEIGKELKKVKRCHLCEIISNLKTYLAGLFPEYIVVVTITPC